MQSVLLSQISADGMISVSWTPPPAPPSNGYRITVDSNYDIDTMSSVSAVALGNTSNPSTTFTTVSIGMLLSDSYSNLK